MGEDHGELHISAIGCSYAHASDLSPDSGTDWTSEHASRRYSLLGESERRANGTRSWNELRACCSSSATASEVASGLFSNIHGLFDRRSLSYSQHYLSDVSDLGVGA